jgi:hypothetical protein
MILKHKVGIKNLHIMLLFAVFFWAGIALGSDASVIRTFASPIRNLRTILTDPRIKWSPRNELNFFGDAGFENATTRWTVFRPPTYQAAVSPRIEADVVAAVNYPPNISTIL